MLHWIFVIALLLIALDLIVVNDPTKSPFDRANLKIGNWCGALGAALLVFVIVYICYQGAKTPEVLNNPLASAFTRNHDDSWTADFLVGEEDGRISFSEKNADLMTEFRKKNRRKEGAWNHRL